jgi:uncharacterized membrane protein
MKIFIAVFLILFTLLSPAFVRAEEKAIYREAVLTNVAEDNAYEIQLSSGKKILVQSPPLAGQRPQYKKGERVIVSTTKNPDGSELNLILDYARSRELLLLFFLFFVVVIAIGRWHGFTSLIGMAASFAIIMWFVIPNILLGNNPVLISLLGGAFMIPITFYLAHGVNKKTSVAVVSTLISLVLTGLLAYLFVELVKLTGFAAEEAVYVQTITGGTVNIKNILLAGIMIGAMGILDDITISQASIVDRLSHANPKYTVHELFQNAMVVGRDHIASLVNTLVLVYTGASLPLFLLMYQSQVSYTTVVNHEMIATEIVRTLVSSIGIIAAVPITTFISCIYLRRK